MRRAVVLLTAAATIALAGCQDASRDTVRVVGSSTVFPFAKIVAENAVLDNPGMKSPLIELTGSGGGIQLFCKGLGADTPDVVNTSRRMKLSEFQTCQANNVKDITEIQVGLDGIALAAKKGGIMLQLTPALIYRAIAARPFGKPQTAQKWSDVDPALPDAPILVYGPPTSSGTRDALEELIMKAGCLTDPAMKALKEQDEQKFETECTDIRTDGAYVDQGEQDNLIVQKIANNPQAVGVFGYSYLEENMETLQDLPINGKQATYENIASFAYPGARPLYMYVKNAHLNAIPGLKPYIAEWVRSWSKGGPLAAKGLVAMTDRIQQESAEKAQTFTPLTAAELK